MTHQQASEPIVYQIQVKGHLKKKWVPWFDDLTIGAEFGPDGTPITTFTGSIADQAALYGLLMKARDLGLFLISVNPIEPSSNQAA